MRQKHGDVFLRGGTYYLPVPLVFTAEDSGTKKLPVVFQNYKNDKPVISGGVRLENLNWQPYTNGIFQAQVPEDLLTEEVSINGQRQVWRGAGNPCRSATRDFSRTSSGRASAVSNNRGQALIVWLQSPHPKDQ